MQADEKALPLHRHSGCSPGIETYYMQSPLMTFMAPDVDLQSPPFTLVLGKGACWVLTLHITHHCSPKQQV